MPRVVMNDGTRSRVVTRPLTSPTSDAEARAGAATTGQVRAGSLSISRAATTTCAVTSEPTERSNSPETITKYWPAASRMIGAERPRNDISDGGARKSGCRMPTQHQQHREDREDRQDTAGTHPRQTQRQRSGAGRSAWLAPPFACARRA